MKKKTKLFTGDFISDEDGSIGVILYVDERSRYFLVDFGSSIGIDRLSDDDYFEVLTKDATSPDPDGLDYSKDISEFKSSGLQIRKE